MRLFHKKSNSASVNPKIVFSSFLLSTVLVACSSDPAPNQYSFLRNTSLSPPTSFSEFRRTNWSSSATIAEREFLVYFDPSIPAESVNRIHDQISSMGAQKLGQASLLRMIQYRADSGVDMNLLLDFALRQPEVITAQPNFAVSPLVRLSPEVSGDVSDGYWWINNIRAREAWDFIESNRLTYSSVPIAIVDSGGIDPSGPLRNRGIQSFTPCSVGSNVTYSITSAAPASSCFSGSFVPWSHANSVGTLLAASGTDGIAGVGMAWRNPVMYFNTGPFFTSHMGPASRYLSSIAFVTSAISLAVEAGARVVNVSVGVNCNSGDTIQSCQNKHASNRANFIRTLMRANQANSLLVFAAGNDGFKHDDVLLPRESSHYEYLFRSNALIVGGNDELDHPACGQDYEAVFCSSGLFLRRASRSNCDCPNCNPVPLEPPFLDLTPEGSAVEIAAPAYRISIPQSDGSVRVSDTSFGTSLAAPMVAGTAALVWGLNPSLRANQVRQILLDTARRGGCRQIGRGILNAGAAVRMARDISLTPSTAPTTSTSLPVGRGFGSGQFEKVISTNDGNFVAVGQVVINQRHFSRILKFNRSLEVLWDRTINSDLVSIVNRAYDVVETPSGYLVVATSLSNHPSLGTYTPVSLYQFDSSGILSSQRSYSQISGVSSPPCPCRITRLSDGSLILFSSTSDNRSTNFGSSGPVMARFNSSGNLVWSRLITPGYSFSLTTFTSGNSSDFFVGGYGAIRQITTGRISGDGQPIGSLNVLDDSSSDLTFASNSIAFASISTFPSSTLLTYSVNDGSQLSLLRRIPFSGYFSVSSALRNSDSSVVLGNVISGSGSNSDANAVLLNVDSSGNLVWSSNFGGVGVQYANSLARTPFGYVICGSSQSLAWLATLDFSGNPIN